MKRLIPYIAFACLTGFAATSGLPVMAMGCNYHKNKVTEIICAQDDIECQTEKSKKLELKSTVRS